MTTETAITLTEQAAEQARQMLSRRGTPDAAIRIGVTTSGCSGFSYRLEYADQPDEGDQQFESQGVRLVVDSKSLSALQGMVVDFEKQSFKSGFKFINPREKARCGCGESFSV
ncbi:MAG: iron-sulfur cluster assembly accessory protein [Magnetococcales bacterium]|nr:iron-sulfur cluster assembly accessory protein [Magnetococcales bacterium]